MNARTKAMKEKIQLQKRGTASSKTNFTKTVTVEVTPTNIIKVITSKGISPYEVEDQVKDLISIGGILPNQKKSIYHNLQIVISTYHSIDKRKRKM